MRVTKEKFNAILEIISRRNCISIDCETTGLRPYHGDRLFSIIIATPDPYYFNFNTNSDIPENEILGGGHLEALSNVLADTNKIVYMHNAKFDMAFLRKEGIEIGGVVHDTKTGERLKYNAHDSYSLSSCAFRIGEKKFDDVEKFIMKNKLFTLALDATGKKQKLKHYDRVPYELISVYGEQDAIVTYKLANAQLDSLVVESKQQKAENLPTVIDLFSGEMALTKVLFEMENIGVKVDVDYCQRAMDYHKDQMTQSQENLSKLIGKKFVDSNKVLTSIFPNLHLKSTKKGKASFPSKLLKKMDHPTAHEICEFRDSKSAINFYRSFLYYADHNNTIHTNFNADGTATGRFSSSQINLQNLTRPSEDEVNPKEFEVRRAFIPREGFSFLMMDYSQAEYRMMLDIAGAHKLIEKINNGLDVHAATSELAGVSRKEAKTTNFLTLYGGGVVKLSEQLYCSVEKARNVRQAIFDSAPEIKKFLNTVTGEAAKTGKIYNPYGRISWFQGELREQAYKAPNYYIQGGVSDMIKVAMVHIDRFLEKKKSRMLLNIHDELVFELADGEEDIIPVLKEIMIQSYTPKNGLSMEVSAECSKVSLADGIPIKI